jgi:glycerol-3-phosphate dehydrogenase
MGYTKNEMARTIDDVLSRRVRLFFLDARASCELQTKLQNYLQKNWDMTWVRTPNKQFKTLANGFLLTEFKSN